MCAVCRLWESKGPPVRAETALLFVCPPRREVGRAEGMARRVSFIACFFHGVCVLSKTSALHQGLGFTSRQGLGKIRLRQSFFRHAFLSLRTGCLLFFHHPSCMPQNSCCVWYCCCSLCLQRSLFGHPCVVVEGRKRWTSLHGVGTASYEGGGGVVIRRSPSADCEMSGLGSELLAQQLGGGERGRFGQKMMRVLVARGPSLWYM